MKEEPHLESCLALHQGKRRIVYDSAKLLNYTLAVTREHDQLRAKMTGQQKTLLFAETETKFYIEATDVHIDFVKDDSGKVTKLFLFRGPQKYEAKRIK